MPLMQQAGKAHRRIVAAVARGIGPCPSAWASLAAFLQGNLTAIDVQLEIMDLHGIEQALVAGDADFLVLDAGQYLRLEAEHGISRLATARRRSSTGSPYVHDAAVLFVRSDAADIQDVTDLRGRSLLGVDRESLAGFQMAWGELLEQGVDPFEDLASLSFSGFPQDEIVRAVQEGRVDAGTMSAQALAELEAQGVFAWSDLRILNLRCSPQFPLPRSTALYPQCVFAASADVSDDIAAAVVRALLAFEPHGYAVAPPEWGPCADLRPVHRLFRRLGVRPYDSRPQTAVAGLPMQYAPLARALSHDIKNPLNVILSLTDLLRDIYSERGNGEIQGCLDDVYEAGERIHELVAGVTEFALAEMRQPSGEHEVISVREVLDEVAAMLRKVSDRVTVECEVDFPPERDGLSLPKVRLKALLFNFLHALVRLRDVQTVRVAVHADGGILEVTVTWDSGPTPREVAQRAATVDAPGTSTQYLDAWVAMTARIIEVNGGSFNGPAGESEKVSFRLPAQFA